MERHADALAWLAKQKRLMDAGAWEPESAVEQRERASRITVADYAVEWLENRRTAKGEPLRETTKYKLRTDIENHVLPYLGHMRLADVTQRDIDGWLDRLPRGQESMRANALKVMKAMLRTASMPGRRGEQPIIPVNPCTIPVPKPMRKSRTVPATPEQVKVIYDHMPEAYRMVVYLSVFADGLRIGEACALQRGDIDLDARILRVRRGRLTMGPDIVGAPKTRNSYRDSQLPSQLMPLLEEFLAKHVDKAPDSWLFPTLHDRSVPVHPNSIRTWYGVARAAAGRPDLRFHDLRHTALTWMAQDGATVRELMDAAGHADAQIAMRYQHSVATRRAAQADALGARIIEDGKDVIRERIASIDRRLAELRAEREGLVAVLGG